MQTSPKKPEVTNISPFLATIVCKQADRKHYTLLLFTALRLIQYQHIPETPKKLILVIMAPDLDGWLQQHSPTAKGFTMTAPVTKSMEFSLNSKSNDNKYFNNVNKVKSHSSFPWYDVK